MELKKTLVFITLLICFPLSVQAAPCYGTRMPEKGGFFAGQQTHLIFNRDLEGEFGEVRSTQNFFQLSYGPYQWLSIDLKIGVGNIKQHPVGSDEVDYTSSFAGGYGFRIKLYDSEKIDLVYGFQHISVHPKSVNLGNGKNTAVLDDWQTSLLASYSFSKITPYLGLKFSRVDYIHWVEEDRKRKMSNLTKTIGIVCGLDLDISDNVWFNVEGQFLDGEALAFGINFKF